MKNTTLLSVKQTTPLGSCKNGLVLLKKGKHDVLLANTHNVLFYTLVGIISCQINMQVVKMELQPEHDE